MSFREIIGHDRPIELLKRAIENDRIAQSYLFVGNDGIGKKRVALQFAKVMNCLGESSQTSDSCDHCLSCRKINDHLHPDVLVLEPEGQTLKVEQVRQMQRDLAYRPYEGKRRVCVLCAADRMAPNMSNALLKTLEEPPLHTVIILLANHPRLLLPTILSRCRPIRFNPLPVPIVEGWLLREMGLDSQEAHLLASLSEGSFGKALEIREEIAQIPREALLDGLVAPRAFSRGKMETVTEALPSQRENLLLILEVVKTLLRDLVVIKTMSEGATLIHSDLSSQIKKAALDWSLSALLKRMDLLHQTTLVIRGNANTTLALEAMMLSWAQG